MLAIQLIGGTVIFLRQMLSRDSRPESVVALFLGFLILVLAGFVSSSARIRIPIAVLKAAFCLLLGTKTPLPLLLLPSIGLELPETVSGNGSISLLWAGYSAALSALAFLVPREIALYYLGFWSLAVFIAASVQRHAVSEALLTSRVRELERESAEAEAKRSALQKASAGQELLIKLQERDSIAQKLHDDLGHTMTGSIMQLEAAGLLFKDDPGRAKELIGKVSHTLKEGLSSIRLSLKAIKPEPALLGLQRIRGMLDDFEASYGLKADLETEGTIDAMPSELWLAIEGNLREALTNMLKHSSGRRFSCRIGVLNRMYKIEFRDDGIVGPAIRKGMGLDGMESRTREAGGTLIIDTSRGFSAIMLFKKGEPDDGDTNPYRG